jgi:hypothetical protein
VNITPTIDIAISCHICYDFLYNLLQIFIQPFSDQSKNIRNATKADITPATHKTIPQNTQSEQSPDKINTLRRESNAKTILMQDKTDAIIPRAKNINFFITTSLQTVKAPRSSK